MTCLKERDDRNQLDIIRGSIRKRCLRNSKKKLDVRDKFDNMQRPHSDNGGNTLYLELSLKMAN